jgi:hypothetical protein
LGAFLRHFQVKLAASDATGHGNVHAAVYDLMKGGGRDDLEQAKREIYAAIENDKRLAAYVETHNNNRTAVRRQREAFDSLFSKLDWIIDGKDDGGDAVA